MLVFKSLQASDKRKKILLSQMAEVETLPERILPQARGFLGREWQKYLCQWNTFWGLTALFTSSKWTKMKHILRTSAIERKKGLKVQHILGTIDFLHRSMRTWNLWNTFSGHFCLAVFSSFTWDSRLPLEQARPYGRAVKMAGLLPRKL